MAGHNDPDKITIAAITSPTTAVFGICLTPR